MTIKVLSNRLAKELEIDPDIIEKVVRTEFKMIREEMASSNWLPVKLQYLGKFAVKPNRMKHVEAYERYKQERIHSEDNTNVPPTGDGEGTLVEGSV